MVCNYNREPQLERSGVDDDVYCFNLSTETVCGIDGKTNECLVEKNLSCILSFEMVSQHEFHERRLQDDANVRLARHAHGYAHFGVDRRADSCMCILAATATWTADSH